MRLRNIPGSREAIAESQYVIHEEETRAGSWHEIFENDHPIYVEIGMGKGQFLMELARRNPDINYVGIEKYSSVLIRALEKMEEEETPLPNICFIRMDAEDIVKVFAKNEVDRIYLNFSDPWPKDRHAKRRLTSKEFMARYDQILVPDGQVEFKTDNRPLFDFSVESVKEAGWQLKAVTYDLHHDEKLVQGIFELFEVILSYFSNTLSFVRIGAFAVSHAAMMEVVLMLAGAENGSPNWIVIILGNLFVCAMEGLIVGIQVLRLEYYEMFSRFYKGSGRKFEPFCSKNK